MGAFLHFKLSITVVGALHFILAACCFMHTGKSSESILILILLSDPFKLSIIKILTPEGLLCVLTPLWFSSLELAKIKFLFILSFFSKFFSSKILGSVVFFVPIYVRIGLVNILFNFWVAFLRTSLQSEEFQ